MKYAFIVSLYIVLFVSVIHKLQDTGTKERISCGVVVCGILYLSVIFMMDANWPNLNHLVSLLFAKPAEAATHFFMNNPN